MDLNFSPEELAFGAEVRAFIAEAFDAEMRAKLAQSKNNHLDKASQVRWLKRLGDRGWMAPDWPVEYGGTGWSLGQKYIYDMEMALAGAPSTSNMGTKMCAPVVMAFGTDEQKAQHLPRILATEAWWCQGYSEPGSGSDLASVARIRGRCWAFCSSVPNAITTGAHILVPMFEVEGAPASAISMS